MSRLETVARLPTRWLRDSMPSRGLPAGGTGQIPGSAGGYLRYGRLERRPGLEHRWSFGELFQGAPRPKPARVFVNWYLSRKAQILLQALKDLYGELPPNSRRIDIPKDMLPPANMFVDGRKYLDVSRPKFTDMAPISKLSGKIMADIRRAKNR
jgi:hypothetical protein